MNITEIRVNLVTTNKDERLKAFCSITIDGDFVVRDIKVLEGTGGHFIAMPSRKMSDHCERCGGKNHLRAKFCNNCGAHLPAGRVKKGPKGRRPKFHADIAHPITLKCRRSLQEQVIAAYKAELEKSKQPGYTPPQLDIPEDDSQEEEIPEEDIPEVV